LSLAEGRAEPCYGRMSPVANKDNSPNL